MERVNYLIKYSVLFVVLAISGIFACDNTIDPLEMELGSFSIYGGLDMNSERNYIRVMDLKTPLNSNDTELDALVVFENLNTGLSETLEDTLVRFDDVNTFNYIKEGEIYPKTDYKITVSRPDGIVKEVVTRTPPKANHEIQGENRNCFRLVTITLDEVGEDDTVLWNVKFKFDNQIIELPLQLSIPTERSEEGDLQMQFSPQQVLDQFFGENMIQCYELSDDKFFVEYNHHGPGYRLNSSDSDEVIATDRLIGYYREMATVVVDTTCATYPRCSGIF